MWCFPKGADNEVVRRGKVNAVTGASALAGWLLSGEWDERSNMTFEQKICIIGGISIEKNAV